MMAIPPDLARLYESLLARKGVAVKERPYFHKWLRYYLDFCQKYSLAPADRGSVPAFGEKLRSKNQSEAQRQQARQAVAVYFEALDSGGPSGSSAPAGAPTLEGADAGPARNSSGDASRINPSPAPSARAQAPIPSPSPPRNSHPRLPETAALRPSTPMNRPTPAGAPPHVESPTPRDAPHIQEELRPPILPAGSAGEGELKSTGASWVWVYEKLHSAIKVRHYSSKTLQAYKVWIQQFQTYTRSKDARLVSVEDVKGFLSFLAMDRHVAASSQNQAFNALLFLFRHVLEKDFGRVEGVVRAKRRPYIPVVLSRQEVDQVIRRLEYPYDLVAKLLYGCGLRLFECLKLRVQDLNFGMKVLTVHDGKGQKDRTVPLPEVLISELKAQLQTVMETHREDMASGYAGTFLPHALEEKYKRASRELVWQWLFPAKTLTLVPATREHRRYHLHERHVQKAIAQAVRESQIPKRASAHTFRHSFASHLLQANYDIRTIQELLGHGDLKTTMIYTHTVRSVTLKEAKSPLDF